MARSHASLARCEAAAAGRDQGAPLAAGLARSAERNGAGPPPRLCSQPGLRDALARVEALGDAVARAAADAARCATLAGPARGRGPALADGGEQAAQRLIIVPSVRHVFVGKDQCLEPGYFVDLQAGAAWTRARTRAALGCDTAAGAGAPDWVPSSAKASQQTPGSSEPADDGLYRDCSIGEDLLSGGEPWSGGLGDGIRDVHAGASAADFAAQEKSEPPRWNQRWRWDHLWRSVGVCQPSPPTVGAAVTLCRLVAAPLLNGARGTVIEELPGDRLRVQLEANPGVQGRTALVKRGNVDFANVPLARKWRHHAVPAVLPECAAPPASAPAVPPECSAQPASAPRASPLEPASLQRPGACAATLPAARSAPPAAAVSHTAAQPPPPPRQHARQQSQGQYAMTAGTPCAGAPGVGPIASPGAGRSPSAVSPPCRALPVAAPPRDQPRLQQPPPQQQPRQHHRSVPEQPQSDGAGTPATLSVRSASPAAAPDRSLVRPPGLPEPPAADHSSQEDSSDEAFFRRHGFDPELFDLWMGPNVEDLEGFDSGADGAPQRPALDALTGSPAQYFLTPPPTHVDGRAAAVHAAPGRLPRASRRGRRRRGRLSQPQRHASGTAAPPAPRGPPSCSSQGESAPGRSRSRSTSSLPSWADDSAYAPDVIIHGLVNAVHLNGQPGMFDDIMPSGRLRVRLRSGEHVQVDVQNLDVGPHWLRLRLGLDEPQA